MEKGRGSEGRKEEARQINKLLSVSIACVAEMIWLVSPPFTVMMIRIQFRIRHERGCCQAIKGMTWLLWPKVDSKFFHALRICLISSTSAESRALPALSKANKSRYSYGMMMRGLEWERERETAISALWSWDGAKFCLRNVGASEKCQDERVHEEATRALRRTLGSGTVNGFSASKLATNWTFVCVC